MTCRVGEARKRPIGNDAKAFEKKELNHYVQALARMFLSAAAPQQRWAGLRPAIASRRLALTWLSGFLDENAESALPASN